MNNFKIGDIVIFTWKPNCGLWRKGKIVANNFAMCNLPDFFGKPMYYITELDENDNVIDDKTSVAVEKDSKYIVKFEPGMEWCIGKSSSNNWPKVRDFEKEFEDEMLDMKKNMCPFDMILACVNGKWEIDLFQQYINKDKTQIYTFKKHTILHDANWQPYIYEDGDKHFRQLFNVDKEFVPTSHKDSCGQLGDNGDEFEREIDIDEDMNGHWQNFPDDYYDKNKTSENIDVKETSKDYNELSNADYIRWKNQFKNVSKDDYLEIPGLKEMFDDEQEWKEMIKKKLDDINDKLNNLLLFQRTWTDPYPKYPWTPGTPSNPWYDTNKVYCETETHNYTANIPLEDIHKYQETYIDSTDVDFDCKNYTEMNNTRMESTMFGNEVLDDKYDTRGLAAASKKINNNNQNKK